MVHLPLCLREVVDCEVRCASGAYGGRRLEVVHVGIQRRETEQKSLVCEGEHGEATGEHRGEDRLDSLRATTSTDADVDGSARLGL